MKKIASLLIIAAMLLLFSVIIGAADDIIPTDSAWVITASSTHGDESVMRAFDGSAETYWHTNFTVEGSQITSHDEPPYTIDVNFGKEMTVAGWRYTPRSGNGTGIVQEYNIYASTDGKKFDQIYSGKFDIDYTGDKTREPVSAFWGEKKMKAIRIEITQSVSGFGTAAEINFYGKGSASSSGSTGNSSSSAASTGKKIATDSAWVITASSTHGDESVMRAFDGSAATFWHTKYVAEGSQITSHDEPPYTIDVNFGKEMTVAGWCYTPRSGNGTGIVQEYNIYASTDGKKFEKIYTGTFDIDYAGNKTREPVSAFWGEKKMKAIRIEITKSVSGYGTAAEIEFYSSGSGSAASTDQDNKKDEEKTETSTGNAASDGTPFCDRTGWDAEVNSTLGEKTGTFGIIKILDGNVATYWHSKYTIEDGKVATHDDPPYNVIVTLPALTETSGIVMTPRNDSVNGRFFGANIYVSDTDDGEWFLLKENAVLSRDGITQEILFNANIKVKRVRIEATSTHAGFGTLAEFNLVQKNDKVKDISYEEFKAIDEANTIYEIDRTGMTAESSLSNWQPVEGIFDGSDYSFWQTEEAKESDWPIVLTVDLKKVYKLKEIQVLPRQTADKHGTWLKVTVNGSTDNVNWRELKGGLTFPEDIKTRIIRFDNEEEVRYIEFSIEEAYAQRAGAAEITFWESKAAKDEREAADKVKYSLKIGSNVITTEQGGVKTETEIDVAPFIVNGSTMIPLRGLVEQMGAEVSWNGQNKTVTVINGDSDITLQIWSYLVYVTNTKYGDVRYTLLNPPIISDSRTFIPVRFVSEQLGYNVSWDGETQTVTITK